MVDVKTPQGLAAFNELLSTQAFVTGFTLSGEDNTVFENLGKAPEAKYENITRWYKNVSSYEKKERTAWPSAGGSASAPSADDEDIDLFGSDDEEDDAEKAAIVAQRLKEYQEKKSKKAGPIAKSSVILDVKPWDDETDLKELEAKVRSIEMDGLVWGGGKLIPIGYGINKLQIITVIEDAKVSVDDLIDVITAFEDHVQSVDIVAFNKI